MTLKHLTLFALLAAVIGVGLCIPSEARATAQPRVLETARQRSQEPTPLFNVSVNGKGGFIDASGAIVIEPIYEKVYPFSDGLAAVQVDRKWGYIDAQGKMIIEPRFASPGFFSEGLASFCDARNGRWGYIDEQGQVVIQPRFDTADGFRKGLARVGIETRRSKWFKWIADVGIAVDYKYIDRSGAFVPAPHPTHFATGEPGERIPFEEDGWWGYMDAEGRTVIEARFQHASAFSDGLALVWLGGRFGHDGGFGYIDVEGQVAIEPRFEWASSFSDGVAGVKLGDEGWGFIDVSGAVVIERRFDWIYGGFRLGLAEVAKDGAQCYVDRQGDWVWRAGR
jgi:hypothetical protein